MYSNRLQILLQRVVRFFHPRSSCPTHISADVQRITLNASCMMISGERTEQLVIFCGVTGFVGDFLSFIDVELIRFFHGALQYYCFTFETLHCRWKMCDQLVVVAKWPGLGTEVPDRGDVSLQLQR